MHVLNALADGTSVFGLSVYCVAMILLLGTLARAHRCVSSRRNPADGPAARASFVGITSVRMLFRSCADGATAPGEASILTNASKPQWLVGVCPAEISAEP